MNKKIKIIDIFNIISKGDYEALPLNIQVDGNKYNWDNLDHFYRSRDDEDLLELARVYDTVTFLDINVEVLDNNLEDNTEEIEELLTIEDYECDKTDIRLNRDKINELVRRINYIERKINDNWNMEGYRTDMKANTKLAI